MFLVVDEDGNEFIVKVDEWEDGVTDPTAPEAQYAAVEAFLAAQGINATVVDHAIKAGSYQGNSGGGIFLSDGSRVPQSDIDDYWFGEAWTGKAFNGPNVDFEVDFDDLPDADSFADEDPQAKALDDADDAEGDQALGSLSDESDSEAGSDDRSDTKPLPSPTRTIASVHWPIRVLKVLICCIRMNRNQRRVSVTR